jgi:hypothetical protein
MNTMNKVTDRKMVKIVKSFTNGFAQHVYELADGTMLFIDFNETEIEILTTEQVPMDQELSFINSIPEDEA